MEGSLLVKAGSIKNDMNNTHYCEYEISCKSHNLDHFPFLFSVFKICFRQLSSGFLSFLAITELNYFFRLSFIVKIKKQKDLLDSKAITQEEHETMKRPILGYNIAEQKNPYNMDGSSWRSEVYGIYS